MTKYYHLSIDLDSSTSTCQDCTQLFDEWLGGTGVATKLFSEYCLKPCEPLSPDAPVIFAIGPLNIIFPVMTKTVAIFHSPLTGNLGESHAGGRLALAMFESQNHLISIKGKASYPSYIVIENHQLRIEKAKSLWGFSATSTERILRNKEKGLGKRSIMRIGPAGERLSPLACVTVDSSRHFGRLGLGAVLGSKNIKAIVISGNQSLPVPNNKTYTKEYLKLHQTITQSTVMKKYHDLGTPMNVLPLHYSGALPTRNFTQGFFEGASHISGEAFAENDLVQQISCAGCPVGCIHMASHREVYDPQNHMVKTFKVSYDYELIFALGSNLSISSRSEILKLILECERQGWDIMSLGGTLAWATEAYRKGIIGAKESMGEHLRFGDSALYHRILGYISQHANPFYADLEKGVAYCSSKYGGKEFAVHFGGNEAPGYLTGMNAFLGFALGVRHSHLDAAGYDIDQKSAQFASKTDQLLALYRESLERMIFNSLTACLFSRKVYTSDQIVRCFQALDDTTKTKAYLEALSHRILGLKFECKFRLGFSWDSLSLSQCFEGFSTPQSVLRSEDFKAGVSLFSKWIDEDRKLHRKAATLIRF
jgi:aldehyde:ferredoxin oxidoreductase